MIAVVPVRAGVPPLGAVDVVAEAAGGVIVIGSGCAEAANRIGRAGSPVFTADTPMFIAEVGDFRPDAWSRALAPHLDPHAPVLLPASPDGRDLAARLAAATDRPLFANAIRLTEDEIVLTRYGSRIMETFERRADAVVTLQPGVKPSAPPERRESDPPVGTGFVSISLKLGAASQDLELVRELPADPSTMDLVEARRIVGGGAGLGSTGAFELLSSIADRLGASMGGTRVVMDWGWIPFERQIGTTGVVVDPEVYLAFGVSGAVQHTAGLGTPAGVISVNTDPHCPMMAMADLAIVADAPEVLAALSELLTERPRAGDGVASEIS